MRRSLRLATLLLALASVLAWLPTPALAAGTDPVVCEPYGVTVELDDFEITPGEGGPGDTIHFSATFEDEVACVSMSFNALDEDGQPTGPGQSFRMFDEDGDGVLEYEVNLYEGMHSGTYVLQSISIWLNNPDTTGPYIVIVDAEGEDTDSTYYRDLSALRFTINGYDEDVTPPTFLYETLSASPKTATVGDTVTIKVEAYDDFGMSTNPNAGVRVEYDTPRGREAVKLEETAPGVFTATIDVTSDLAGYTGKWQVSNIRVTDDAGNSKTYWNQGSWVSEQDYSALNFELVDLPEPSTAEFTIDYDGITRTPEDDVLTEGTRVSVRVPVMSTNGVTSARVTFLGSCPNGSSNYIPVNLKDAGDGTWTGSFIIPVGSGTGSWKAGWVRATDASGAAFETMTRELTGSESHPSVPSLVFTVPVPEGEADETFPTIDLESCSVSPSRVRKGSRPEYRFSASDDVKVSAVHICLLQPGEKPGDRGYYYASLQDGVWVASPNIYNVALGTTRVEFLEVVDSAGNTTTYRNSYYYPDDENAVDLSFLDVEYFDDNDNTGPVIDEASVRSTPTRATRGDKITFSVDITDGQEVASATLSIRQANISPAVEREITLHRGEGDTWVGEYAVQTYDVSTSWYVCSIIATDCYQNTTRAYDKRISQWQPRDFSSGDFEIYNTLSDIQAPYIDLGSLTATPHVTADGRNLTFRMRVTDDLSGVAEVTACIGRSGSSSASICTFKRVGNTDWYQATVNFYDTSSASEGDYYYAWYVRAIDYSSNLRSYANEKDPKYNYPRANLDGFIITFVDPTTHTDISGATIKVAGEPFVYDGKAKNPEVEVVLGEKTLVAGTDYEVAVTNNVNAGAAVVTVSGIGDYYGSASRRFLIAPCPLSAVDMTPNPLPSVQWFEYVQHPWFSLKREGYNLRIGTDYKVRYANDRLPGEAKVTLVGRGNFTGTRVETYTIEEPFCDVTPATPHYEDILWMYATRISRGYNDYPNREYRPTTPVRRQDMAAFLYRLAGSPYYEPTAADKARFTDVNERTPHCREIWWLASEGISTGWVMKDGTCEFRPSNTIVRQDMAAFLYRMAGSPAYTPTAADRARFSDVTTSTPHHDEVWWLASTGVTTGFSDGTFRGMNNIIRQDMAAFLHRMADKALVKY